MPPRYAGAETRSGETSLPKSENAKSTVNKVINTSEEIIKRIPDFPDFIDKANYALQLIAEGKLNLVTPDTISLDNEKLRLKSFKNNIIFSLLGVVILILLVF